MERRRCRPRSSSRTAPRSALRRLASCLRRRLRRQQRHSQQRRRGGACTLGFIPRRCSRRRSSATSPPVRRSVRERNSTFTEIAGDRTLSVDGHRDHGGHNMGRGKISMGVAVSRAIQVIAISVLHVGCTESVPCKTNADCTVAPAEAFPQRCSARDLWCERSTCQSECVSRCSADQGCGEGQVCVRSSEVCSGVPKGCSADGDCQSLGPADGGFRCLDGVCGRPGFEFRHPE